MRAEGADPQCAVRIAATCAAVRAGFSRFNAAANSSTWAGVRGCTALGEGINASNPPTRHARTHLSNVTRDTRTRSPNGPVCSMAASSRTSTPR